MPVPELFHWNANVSFSRVAISCSNALLRPTHHLCRHLRAVHHAAALNTLFPRLCGAPPNISSP